MMSKFFDDYRDSVILLARILLTFLFVAFGWQKLTGFSGTVTYLSSMGVPAPSLAAVVSIVFELGLGIAIALGFWTRATALLLVFYTLATALIGHRYWTMTGAEQSANMINFYKNVSIAGGWLLLSLIGPGRYSLDSLMGVRTQPDLRRARF